MKNTTLVTIVASLATVIIMACGGADDSPEATTSNGTRTDRPLRTFIDADYLPTIISTNLAVGENRFVIGLLDRTANGAVEAGAEIHFAFFTADDQSTPRFEADAKTLVLDLSFTHLHEDGGVHIHEAGETGAYIAYVGFDIAGDWDVEVTGSTKDGVDLEPVRLAFTVREEHIGLSVGDPAPPTRQTLLADVDDIGEIDTSQVPIPEQHDMTIDDAIASGRPTAIAIATPAFCTSQICGPMKELFDQLYENNKDVANFIHVEPYDIECARSGNQLYECTNPIIEEWGLRNEPWIFIVDADGIIAAAFEGIAGLDEMQAALDATL
jgi:hypothetical protein